MTATKEMLELTEATTVLCKKEDVEIPREGDFSMLQLWPMKPVEAFRGLKAFEVIDMHWLCVAVIISEAQRLQMPPSWWGLLLGNVRKSDGVTVIEFGSVVGSLELAFRLFALGSYWRAWDLKTPIDYGCQKGLADSLSAQFIRVTEVVEL